MFLVMEMDGGHDISGEAESFLSVNKIHGTLPVFSNTPPHDHQFCWRRGELQFSDWVGRWGPIGPMIAMVNETLETWVEVEMKKYLLTTTGHTR